MKQYGERDAPHSEAEHNPMWCEGSDHGQCCSDDPCWSCIHWAFDEVQSQREALELCRSALEPIATKPDAPFIVVSAYENACLVLGKKRVPTSGTKSPEVAPET